MLLGYACLVLVSYWQPIRADLVSVDCVSVQSDGGYETEARVSCSDAGDAYASYVMTGCGFRHPWRETVESYIDATGECVAVSSKAAPYGVTATAQCCDLQGIFEVQLVEDSSSEIDVLVSNCPDDSQLMGCVAPGESCGGTTSCDTVLSNSEALTIDEQSCAFHPFAATTTISAQTVCATRISENHEMECTQIVGAASGSGDDNPSSVSCQTELGEDWFLTSCGEYVGSSSSRPYIDGHAVEERADGQVCTAWNSGWPYNESPNVVYPVAQCCRIQSTSNPNCASLPIDAYLTSCSAEFAANELDIESLHSAQSEASVRLDGLQADITDNGERIDELGIIQDTMQTEMTANGQRIGELEIEKDEIQSDITANGESIDELDNAQGTMQADITTNAQGIDDLASTQFTMQSDITSNGERIGELDSEQDTMQSEITANSERLDELEITAELFGALQSRVEEIEAWKEVVVTFESESSAKSVATSELFTGGQKASQPQYKDELIGALVATNLLVMISFACYMIGGKCPTRKYVAVGDNENMQF